MYYENSKKDPNSFEEATGVSIDLFDEFLPYFTYAHDEFLRWHTFKGHKISRRRSHVIQSNSPLPSVADRLFFILNYLKNKPTQEVQASAFGMSQQQCGQWLRTLKRIFRLAVEDANTLPPATIDKLKTIIEK